MKTSDNLPKGFAVQRTRSPNLDYAKIFDGSWHVFVQGTVEQVQAKQADFISTIDSFTQNMKDQARTRGFQVNIAIDQSNPEAIRIAVQAIPRKGAKVQASKTSKIKSTIRKNRGGK
jgi:predicted N-formylglutamate amidohydrolase